MVEPAKAVKTALAAGGLAAVLASACCLGPLVLVGIGVSGAWIGNLSRVEPFRPLFIGAAVIALFFAYRRIFRPVAACAPEQMCAQPPVRSTYKGIFWVVVAMVVVAVAYPYVVPFFY